MTGYSGRHAGRGPKNYKRSDDRIREDINEHLTHHPEVDATEIEVQVSNGEVTLTGTVEHRHAKRMAEDIAEGVSGVKEVHNQIRVQKSGEHEQQHQAGQQPAGQSTATSSTSGGTSTSSKKS
jgi:Flp pilus assembly secretin CpaC